LAGSQLLEVSPQAQICYSKYDNAYLVFDDSNQYWRYDFSTKKWRINKVHLILDEGLPYEQFKNRYTPIAIAKNRCLFVLDGCGIVYEFKNDTIRRIDNSYDQKNQFESAMYEFENKVYMFGGYGLFTVKNLHTYFDRQAGEWFEVLQNNKALPAPRSTPFFIQDNAQLYILGGYTKTRQNSRHLDDIWTFNLKTKKWNCLGKLNPIFSKLLKNKEFRQNKNYNIFHVNNKLVIADPKQNVVKSYASSHYFTFFRMIQDKTNKYVLLAKHTTHNGSRIFLEVRALNSILFGKPKTHLLYAQSNSKFVPSYSLLFWLSLSINGLLLAVIFYFRKPIKSIFKSKRKTTLLRAEFTEFEWKALQMISSHGDLELSALNDFFDEEGLSYETLKKRRESFLRALRIKLTIHTNKEVDELLQEFKHPLDKRMKIIRWNADVELEN
jgi:hypothetical protein